MISHHSGPFWVANQLTVAKQWWTLSDVPDPTSENTRQTTPNLTLSQDFFPQYFGLLNPLTPRVIDSTGMLQVSIAIYLLLSHVFKTDLDANHRYDMFTSDMLG